MQANADPVEELVEWFARLPAHTWLEVLSNGEHPLWELDDRNREAFDRFYNRVLAKRTASGVDTPRRVQTRPPLPFETRTYRGEPEAPRWLFRGLLEQGTCAVLAAAPKAGKTWLTFDLGIALVTGQQFLAWRPVERGPVVYYSPEGGHRSRHARIVGLCWGRDLDPATVLPSLHFVDARLDLANAEAQHAARLGATIDATGARLVVVDPLVSASMGIDENSAGDMMRVLNPLRDMIQERPDCTLIVAHHVHKGAREQSRNIGLRGSSAIGGWWDTLITLRRADEDESSSARRIDIDHRDAAAPAPLGFELAHAPRASGETEWFRLDACEAPELKDSTSRAGRNTLARTDERAAKVETALDSEWRSGTEISKRAGVAKAFALEHLKVLKGRGVAEDSDKGRWRKAAVPAMPEPQGREVHQTAEYKSPARFPPAGTNAEPRPVSRGGSRFSPPLGGEPEPEPMGRAPAGFDLDDIDGLEAMP